MYRWVLAWRWLKSLPILWVSGVGVLLGVASILVVDSIFHGVTQELSRIWRGSASDITVQTLPAPARERGATLPTDAMLRTIVATEGVVGAAPRLRRPCVLPPGMKLPEVIAIGAISRRSVLDVLGVDPAAEDSVGDFQRYLAAAPESRRVRDAARPFDLAPFPDAPAGALPLLIGERCAQALHLAPGSLLELMTIPDVDDETVREQGVTAQAGRFVVVGTFATGSFIEDLTRAYAPRAELARFAATLAPSTEIAVRAATGADLDVLCARLRERLRPYDLESGFETPILTWAMKAGEVLDAIDNQRGVLDLCLFFIVIVAGFNLLVSIHLLVTEKMRDVGTLASLGGSALGIASIFTALGVLVTVIGALLGLVTGALLANNINAVHDALSRWTGGRLWDPGVYFFERIPVAFQPELIGLAVAATFAVTLLFAFLASLRVARLDPVETLRHE